MEKHLAELKNNGYTVIPDVLTPEEVAEALLLFKEWQATVPDHDNLHKKCDPHGIYKHHEVGHQEHAWFIRTRPKVREIFEAIWKTQDLVVGFDGSCWLPKDLRARDNWWCHSDQSPQHDRFLCAQSVIGLTDNKERTLVVWEKTHKIHHKYFNAIGKGDEKGHWQRVPDRHEKLLRPLRRVLHIPAGAMAVWDSRTFHQNQYGSMNCEERYAQYVCMMPRNAEENTKAVQDKRRHYFETRRTTSHWPYPIRVNGLQPRTYGDRSLAIDYSQLRQPNLERFAEEIERLL